MSKLQRLNHYVLCGLLLTLPFSRLPSVEVSGPHGLSIGIDQVLGLILIVLNLGSMWKNRRWLLRSPLLWAGLFVIICAASITQAVDTTRALEVTAYTGFVVALATAVAVSLRGQDLKRYLGWLYAGAAVAVAFGFYQFFGDLLGLSHSLTGLREQYGKIVFGFPRIQSTGLEPLYFGNYLLIPIGILIAEYLFRRPFQWWRWLLLITSLTALWLTVSRGALVALLIMVVIQGVLALRSQPKRAVVVVGSLIVSFGLAIGCIILGSAINKENTSASVAVQNFSEQSRTVTTGESSVSRSIARQVAFDGYTENPALGLGTGNYGIYANEHRPDEFNDRRSIVNNEPLEIMAETGSIGLFAILLFALALLYQSRIVLHKPTTELGVWGLALLTSLIAIAIQYQTFSTLYIVHIWVAIGLLIGVLRMLSKVSDAQDA